MSIDIYNPFVFGVKEVMYMLEKNFQSKLIKEIKELFPGCVVLKNDPNYIQGFPDLLVLHKNKWAALEAKKSTDATRQANQEHYVKQLDNLSYASFICPENKQEVLDELQQSLSPGRASRFSKRK